MIRDTRKNAAYWAEKLPEDRYYLAKHLSKMSDPANSDQVRGRRASSYVRDTFSYCLALYSSGAPMEEIAALGKKLLCEVYPQYLRDQLGGKMYGPQRPSTSTMARYFALLVLSRPTPEEARRFITAYDHWDFQGPPVPGERDRICEAYVARFAGTRKWPASWRPKPTC